MNISNAKHFCLIVFLIGSTFNVKSQSIKWINPANNSIDVIDGRSWDRSETENIYDRLPFKAKELVRKPLWDLSKQSAGLKIRFRTNATEIKIRYALSGSLAMPHMPTTGVSGIDLYASLGKQSIWLKGNYTFADTTSWQFTKPDKISDTGSGIEYTLFLPLYNQVMWLEIGIPDTTSFTFVPKSTTKPIVVYGTSIAQGGCASRPGMAWTALLERSLNIPLINLGFSGNGRLEPEIIQLMTEKEAAVYVLDCLPNLTTKDSKDKDIQELIQKILTAVRTIRQKCPLTPIVLTDHAGYADGAASFKRDYEVSFVNCALLKAYRQLKHSNIKHIYILTQKKIGMNGESTVDGIHPSDLGMMQHAKAYEKLIRKILHN
jgi:lysophospholipase L1-like esterase